MKRHVGRAIGYTALAGVCFVVSRTIWPTEGLGVSLALFLLVSLVAETILPALFPHPDDAGHLALSRVFSLAGPCSRGPSPEPWRPIALLAVGVFIVLLGFVLTSHAVALKAAG
jgi:hypothetical protein